MMLPFAASNYHISSPYGWRRGEFHGGIDFGVAHGTIAVSTVDGVIESVRNLGNRSYGLYVVIRDKQGHRHYYAHLSGTFVRSGQRVGAGAPIGRTGSSGRSTGPHLHYEVRAANGRSINPSAWLAGGMRAPSGEIPAQTAVYEESAPKRQRIPALRARIQPFPSLDPRGFVDAIDQALGVAKIANPEQWERAYTRAQFRLDKNRAYAEDLLEAI